MIHKIKPSKCSKLFPWVL